ncbi:ABC transporter permease [Lacrimispora sp. JR3]|uniref:ABC transporter permease n=1 Tax=Lacrimispora sinapis TaxID=3111456 RepID=UPI003747D12A
MKLTFFQELRKNKMMYLMTLPGIIFFIIFCYIPMAGLIIAFQDFNMIKGIFGSKFNGIENFKFLFQTGDIYKVTANTLYLNILFILFSTVFAIALAIMFNETRQRHYKRIAQTISLLPYFISWVVIYLILYSFVNRENGIITMMLARFGIELKVFSSPKVWPALLVFLKIWQGAGYSAIVYIASITSIDTGIYEAASIDGASRWSQITRITLPILRPTIILMTLFSVGRIFYGDFGMIYALVGDNSLLFPTTDVIDTYVLRSMRNLQDYGMATATGMLQSVLGFVFVYCANKLARSIEPDSAIF